MGQGAPIWAMAVMLATVLVVGLAAGWRVYDTTQRRGDTEASTGAGYIVSAALGLLSLLIGFTLAMSLDRYEIRRKAVVDEAVAISTAELRYQLFDEPFRGRLQALLRDYVRERLALPSVGTAKAALDAADHRTEALQAHIWREVVGALRQPAAGPLATAELQITNEMFDLTTVRRAALDAVVPPPVLWTLTVVAILAAGVTGYGLEAGGHRHRIVSIGLFAAVAITIGLIFELDEPRGGLIQVPQAPMERVAATVLAPASP